MSKSTTPTAPKTAQPAVAVQPQACSTTQGCVVPQDKIAMLAYQKWVKGGCKHGEDKKHWLEAEKELQAEMVKTGAGRAK